MATKSYFTDEVYEVSSLKSMLNSLISNHTETDNQIVTDILINNYLVIKIVF